MIGLKNIAIAALACFAVGLVAAPAGADDRHDRRGGHEHRAEHGDDGEKQYEKIYREGRRDGYREARRDEWRYGDWRRDDEWRRHDDDRRYERDFSRDRGLRRGWRIGERPPRDRVVVIRDHRERRYPRPPLDAHYVSIDRDVFLVAAATGVIIDVLRRD